MHVPSTLGRALLRLGILPIACIALAQPSIVDSGGYSPSTTENKDAPALKVTLIGFVTTGSGTLRWQAILKELIYGETLFLNEGDIGFGYVIKRIIASEGIVVLARGPIELVLKVGEGSGKALQAKFSAPPPWLSDWRSKVAVLVPEEQKIARDGMRDYWKQQWENGLADLVRQLKPEDQVKVREQIRSFWGEE